MTSYTVMRVPAIRLLTMASDMGHLLPEAYQAGRGAAAPAPPEAAGEGPALELHFSEGKGGAAGGGGGIRAAALEGWGPPPDNTRRVRQDAFPTRRMTSARPWQGWYRGEKAPPV